MSSSSAPPPPPPRVNNACPQFYSTGLVVETPSFVPDTVDPVYLGCFVDQQPGRIFTDVNANDGMTTSVRRG